MREVAREEIVQFRQLTEIQATPPSILGVGSMFSRSTPANFETMTEHFQAGPLSDVFQSIDRTGLELSVCM